MKRMALLTLVVILLTACQPVTTPQPTVIPPTNQPTPMPSPKPVEALARSVKDLVGIWWFTQAGLMLEFKADGTYRVFFGTGNQIETADAGKYTFDAGRVTWESSEGACIDKPATYEAFVTNQDGKGGWLRMQVVGSDPCRERVDTTVGNAKFQNP